MPTRQSLYAALLLIIMTFLISNTVTAANNSGSSITVKGLFKGAALLIVDGKHVMLKEGKTKQGITLIKATSQDALLNINGQRQRVGLSRQVGGHYQQTTPQAVRIASRRGGHHWTNGIINGRNVEFLVDTGASFISFNLSTAKRLGIDYKNGERGYLNTANGVTEMRLVNLQKVTVGELTFYNVKAAVSLNDALSVALLGNSFLNRTNMRTEDGVLILEKR